MANLRYSDLTALRRAIAGGDVRIVGGVDTADSAATASMHPAPAINGRAAPTEHEEQARLVAACAALSDRYPDLRLLAAIPNGEYRPKRTAARLKAAGVRPGAPDLVLFVPRPKPDGSWWHGLALELKAAGGKVSAAQRWWHDALRAQGYAVVVAYGADEALGAVLGYLGQGSVSAGAENGERSGGCSTAPGAVD